MSRTDTQAELEKFKASLDPRPGGERRRWAIGGAVAAVAATAAFIMWSADFGDDRSTPDPAPAAQTPEEAVAQRFVGAIAAGDAGQAASYLAPGAEAWDGWRLDIRVDRAFSIEYIIEPCRERDTLPAGTRVVCPFDHHGLHSEQLGLGPFTNNSFTVLVVDGQVVSADIVFNHQNNGFGEHYQAVLAWVEDNHPEDYALMYKLQDELTAAEIPRWLQLWERRSQEYASAMTQAGG